MARIGPATPLYVVEVVSSIAVDGFDLVYRFTTLERTVKRESAMELCGTRPAFPCAGRIRHSSSLRNLSSGKLLVRMPRSFVTRLFPMPVTRCRYSQQKDLLSWLVVAS